MCIYISYAYRRVLAALGDQTVAHTSLAVESAGAGHIWLRYPARGAVGEPGLKPG